MLALSVDVNSFDQSYVAFDVINILADLFMWINAATTCLRSPEFPGLQE